MKRASRVHHTHADLTLNAATGIILHGEQAPIYSIRIKSRGTGTGKIDWQLERAPKVETVPSTDPFSENDYSSFYKDTNNTNGAEINDIRLFDNHILWLKSSVAATVEVVYTTGF